MLLSFAYLAFSVVLRVLVRGRLSEFAKDVELLVQHWAPAAPDELTASLLIAVPGAINEPPSVTSSARCSALTSMRRRCLKTSVPASAPTPRAIQVAHGSYHDTRRYLTALGDQFEELDRASSQPVPAFSKSEFLPPHTPGRRPRSTASQPREGARAGETRELDFMPWGGPYNRLPIDAAAFPHRRERFLLKHTIALRPHASQEQTQAARRWLARSWNATHPYGSGGVYANFPDPELSDPARAYYGSNLDRLRVVKRNYDPDGVFHSGPLGLCWATTSPTCGPCSGRRQSELAARSHARPMRSAPQCGRTR